MIDIESQLLDGLKKLILATYPTAKVIKPSQKDDTYFPTITFQESDYKKISASLNYAESKATILFQVDIFTDGALKELTAKDIRKIVDAYMFGVWHMRLIRAREMPTGTTVYRYLMQYQTNIDEKTGQMFGNQS